MSYCDWDKIQKADLNTNSIRISHQSGRVVFFGDSITEGWSIADPDFLTNNYINRGISGQTTSQMLTRFWADVIDLRPQVVVILAGTNDIAGNTGPSTLEMIENNLAYMTRIATDNHLKVILCSVLPAFDFPWRTGQQPAGKIVTLNAWINKHAASNGYGYADYWSALADERKGMPEVYAEDGVHPTKKGYEIMKNIIQEAIFKVLK